MSTATDQMKSSAPGAGFDPYKVREDFPILKEQRNGNALSYLDNAATAQKPHSVVQAVDWAYEHAYSNVHRGVHMLSERATKAYEDARAKIANFVNARDRREIIFVRGTTEAINLVAAAWGRANIREGDEILITEMEHHSNIVPWQLLRDQTGATLRVVPINDDGELIMEEFERLLNEKTKLVGVGHVSNSLGTINPVKRIIDAAHSVGAKVLVDGAQSTPHLAVDVQALDCDFYAFSGHKLYGPSGIGALYGKYEILEDMPPYQGGGEMIRKVTFEKSEYAKPPAKFEAGTPNIVGPVGLGAAIDYISALGLEAIAAHEDELLRYAVEAVSELKNLRVIGTAPNKAGILSFVFDDIHPHDIGTIVDSEGVAIRAGHHCAMPVMQHFNVPATARASFGLYNTKEDVDAFVRALHKVREVLG